MMMKIKFNLWSGSVTLLYLTLLSVSPLGARASGGDGSPEMKAHYVEIVSTSVDKQCLVLEQVNGLTFGPKVPELGNAKVAKLANGTMIGVRAPMANHEKPITRIYFEVEDINAAVKKAEATGAVIAYPPTKQGKTGTWAIYILDGIQYGLWQE